jgi:hypothetical protein
MSIISNPMSASAVGGKPHPMGARYLIIAETVMLCAGALIAAVDFTSFVGTGPHLVSAFQVIYGCCTCHRVRCSSACV